MYYLYNPAICSFAIFNLVVFNIRTEKRDKKWWNAYVSSSLNYGVSFVLSQFINIPIKSVFNYSDVFFIIPHVLLADAIFYLTHRTFHSKYLYYFHKQHHVWNKPISVSTFDAHPIEHLCVNMSSVLLPLYVIPITLPQQALWITFATLNAIKSHLYDYDEKKLHVLHHIYRNVNYGTGFFLMDRVFGTFRNTIQ